jgi:hypothetical protein
MAPVRRAGDPVSGLPGVTEIHRWTIQPGDRLIIRCDQPLTAEQAAGIRDKVRQRLQLPESFPLVVIGADITIEVAPGPPEGTS